MGEQIKKTACLQILKTDAICTLFFKRLYLFFFSQGKEYAIKKMNSSNYTINEHSHPVLILWVWGVRAFIAILTVIGNALVMGFILKYRKLRTIPNVFIFSLALADILVGLVITPSDYICRFMYLNKCDMLTLRTVYDILLHLSVTNLCTLTFDRYMAVVQPLRYHTLMTKAQVAIILAFTWILAAVMPVAGFICLVEKYILTAKVLRIIDMVFLQISPPVLLAVAYVRMVYIARSHEKTVKQQEHQLSFNYGDAAFINKRDRKRFKESRERASIKMIGAVIVVFLLCYILAISRSLVFYILHKDIPHVVTHISRLMLLANSSVNFIVYGFLKKDFRKEISNLLRNSYRFKEFFIYRDLLSRDDDQGRVNGELSNLSNA